MGNEQENLPATKEEAPELHAVGKLLSSDVVNSTGFLVRSQCKICNSPLRKEAEELYENSKNCSEVKAWLENNGLEVCVQNVRHHMREHYGSMERMIALAEYCSDLQGMMEQRRSRKEDFEMLVNMARIEMARIVSIPTSGSLVKEKERNNMLVSTMKSMRDSLKELNAMSDADARAKAVEFKFIETWKAKIEQAKSPEEKKMYTEALQSFRDSLEDE